MPKDAYTPQESDIWNYTWTKVFVERIGRGEGDEEAGRVALEVAYRSVKTLRKLQGK